MARGGLAKDSADERISQLLHPQPIEVEDLRRWLGLTQEEFGRAVGRSRRTVARWSSISPSAAPRRSAVSARLRRLVRLRFLLENLLEPCSAREWLRLPNPAFRGEAPIDLLTTGRGDQVIAALETLADGGRY